MKKILIVDDAAFMRMSLRKNYGGKWFSSR